MDFNSGKINDRYFQISGNPDQLNRMRILLVSFIVMITMSMMKILTMIIITREIIKTMMALMQVRLKSSLRRIVVVRGARLNYYLRSPIINSLRFLIFQKIIIKDDKSKRAFQQYTGVALLVRLRH